MIAGIAPAMKEPKTVSQAKGVSSVIVGNLFIISDSTAPAGNGIPNQAIKPPL